MLISHFKIKHGEEEEEREEAQPEEIIAPVEEEKVIEYEYRALKKPEISTRLTMLGKTAEGDGYTYLKLKCTGLGLTDISLIKCFKHLQFVDLSNNNIESAALQAVAELPYLVLLHVDHNKLNTPKLKICKYLQVIIMNNNKLTSVFDVYHPELCTLEVGNNMIRDARFETQMPNLKCLDFRHNLLQDLTTIDYVSLDSLYLADNKITTLEGLEILVNLRILHLRNNPLKFLTGFGENHKKLSYVNFRGCKIGTLRQVRKLRPLPVLETLVLKGTPLMGGNEEEGAAEEDDADTRIEILAALPRLKRLNKGIYSPEDRKEAKELMNQWVEEGEKDEDEEIDEEQVMGEGEQNPDSS